MEFDRSIEFLAQRLRHPLPGAESQKRMAPSGTERLRFDPELKKKARKGAVLILIHPKGEQAYFPLIQRPQYNGVHSGQIALPGGKMEDNDEDLIKTALRETQEEIGVSETKVKVLGTLTELFIPASNFNVLPVVGYANSDLNFVPDNHEVHEVVNTNLDHLLDDKNKGISDIVVQENISLSAPYFDINEKVVWGATAMILSELVDLFDHS